MAQRDQIARFGVLQARHLVFFKGLFDSHVLSQKKIRGKFRSPIDVTHGSPSGDVDKVDILQAQCQGFRVAS